MTKKDYDLIANLFSTIYNNHWVTIEQQGIVSLLVDDFACAFYMKNKKFNRYQFIEKCKGATVGERNENNGNGNIGIGSIELAGEVSSTLTRRYDETSQQESIEVMPLLQTEVRPHSNPLPPRSPRS